jgi:4-hydroxybenzoyl-CoA thioesterase
MWFEREKLIRFNHCDPAGIIFYPQYFVLFHELMEDWFGEALGTDYGAYIRKQRLGVPAVKAECEFLSQAKLGDRVRFRIEPLRLGKSSLELVGEVLDGTELRARARITVVQMSLETRRAVPFSDPLRERIAAFLRPPT